MSEPSTQLIHHPYMPPAGFEAVAPPVHKASTIIFPSVAALRGLVALEAAVHVDAAARRRRGGTIGRQRW